MTKDCRIRVDQFFAASKTLEGAGSWYNSERLGVRKFQREVAEDGVSHGFRLEINAFVNTNPREFRFLITGLGQCVCRLDCAPVCDGEHVNGPKRPMGYPFAVTNNHLHDWPENRKFSKASGIYELLPYALEINDKIDNIGQGFWQFCNIVGISATSADEPDWPKTDGLF